MALNISAWSIRRPLPAIVFSIILLLLGWTSFIRLPITRLPNADIPVVSVIVTQFGAGPSELESASHQIHRRRVSGVEGVRHIASQITDGRIGHDDHSSGWRRTPIARSTTSRTRSRGHDSNLPRNIDASRWSSASTWSACRSSPMPRSRRARRRSSCPGSSTTWCKRALQGVRGVAQVERIGGVDREILVSLDPDRLQAVGLTAADVSQRLRGTNVDLAGGRAEIGGRDQAIRTLAGSQNPQRACRNDDRSADGRRGPARGSRRRHRHDRATPRTFARLNGEPVVAFGIWRSKGASDVVVAAAVQKRIDEIRESHPDVELKLIDTSVDFTLGNYEAAMHTLFEGAVLAVDRGVPVPARFARDSHRRGLAAAVDLPRLLGDGHCWASRSIS